MKLSEYAHYDALGLAALIRDGEVTAAEVATAASRACERANPRINAVVEWWGPDEDTHYDSCGPLAGVPLLLKDLAVSMRGKRSELGSRLAAGLVSPADSTLMSRFRQAGLVALGRTATPELAVSTTTESAVNGPTRNPWNPAHGAGGSSGGAGAAVAAGIVPLAHATDGGGSIRVPASVNGVFGLKPSRGLLPVGPDVDEVWSGLAVHGVISRSVRDSAAVLDRVRGPAVGDPFVIAAPEHAYLDEVEREPGSLRVGLLTHPLDGNRCDPAVVAALERLAAHCQALGHRVEVLDLDIGLSWEAFVELNACFWTINTSAWINTLAEATGRRPGPDTLEPITLAVHRTGESMSAMDVLAALQHRNLVTRRMGQVFTGIDVLLSPTLPKVAPLIGQYDVGAQGLDGRQWIHHVFAQSPFTALANVCGIPAMSVPASLDPATGLPIGVQFCAAFGQEGLLFRLAGQLERSLRWQETRPALWAPRLD